MHAGVSATTTNGRTILERYSAQISTALRLGRPPGATKARLIANVADDAPLDPSCVSLEG